MELYARRHGRQGTLHFFLGGGWFATLSLRVNDKRMKLYQEGRAEEPPVEKVWFHIDNPGGTDRGVTLAELRALDEPLLWACIAMDNGRCRQRFLPLDITQMGAEGVKRFLERGNMWSGRGEYDSLEEQLQDSRERSKAATEKHRQDQKEANRHEQREKRRQRFKIPFLPVGIDLKGE